MALEGLVHRLPCQPHHPCDGGDRLALSVKLADQRLLLLRQADAGADLAPASAFALGLGLGDAGQLPFLANLGLVLADAGQHDQHQPTGGRS